MRIAYLDCFAGLAGDMFLGALLDAGVPEHVLHDATRALGIGASLRIERVDRSGISSTKVYVLEGDALAEEHTDIHQHAHQPHSHQPHTQHLHKAGHDGKHDHEHGHKHEHDHKHDHDHDGGAHPHSHDHRHPHVHGRSLTVIRQLIADTALVPEVKSMATRAFELLGASEARIHNVPVDDIHFHEVGAVDAIVDIVATCAGIHHLAIGKWYSSPVNVGGGMVQCAHGTFPVPAPATADLLRETPTYSAHVQKELVTPTGAALLRMLAPSFGQQPAMQVEHIGYGAGTRNPEGFPNVLRLSIGNAAPTHATADAQPAENALETVAVLETALDDASPQVLAFVAEQALAQGALDVMLTPVIMKKGRPGTLITVLCHTEKSASLQALLLRETPTLGVRIRTEKRTTLQRRHVSVDTAFGPIRIKLGSEGDALRNAAPEYEDCKQAALAHNVPLRDVQQQALSSFQGTGAASR